MSAGETESFPSSMCISSQTFQTLNQDTLNKIRQTLSLMSIPCKLFVNIFINSTNADTFFLYLYIFFWVGFCVHQWLKIFVYDTMYLGKGGGVGHLLMCNICYREKSFNKSWSFSSSQIVEPSLESSNITKAQNTLSITSIFKSKQKYDDGNRTHTNVHAVQMYEKERQEGVQKNLFWFVGCR